MKNELTYNEAFAGLEVLVGQLEEGDIALEQLAAKIKEANGLIEICENKLRKTGAEISSVINPKEK